MDNNKTFDSLFEGMDLTPEAKEQIRAVFEDAVQKKVQEVQEGLGPVKTKSAAYAVGTKKAMEMTGDEPPLKKSTITKAHKIAKGVMKTAGIKEEEDIVTLESEEEMDKEDMVDEAEDPALDPKELAFDQEMLKVLRALGDNPQAFSRSLQAAISDISGNKVADDAFMNIVTILQAIADDSNVANFLVLKLKDMKKAENSPAPAEKTPATGKPIEAESIEVHEAIIESVDKYLTYIAESWVEDNKLAVDQGIKLEILESFFNGAKNLLSEHNISIPEGKDPVKEANAKVRALQEQLAQQKETYENQINEEISKTIAYKERVVKEIKNNIFESVSRDLTVVQKERFKKLVESVTYESKSSYEQKIKDIAKNAFEVSTKTSKKNLTEEALRANSEAGEEVIESPVMSLYANAISKNLKF